jgi:hypothetical protein
MQAEIMAEVSDATRTDAIIEYTNRAIAGESMRDLFQALEMFQPIESAAYDAQNDFESTMSDGFTDAYFTWKRLYDIGHALRERIATLEEAYEFRAASAGMSIDAYLICARKHTENGEIFLSGFWSAPIGDMTKVVVFDNGKRYGVTAGTASTYTGEVYDMPKGEAVKCEGCKEVTLIISEEKEDPRNFDSLSALESAVAFMMPLMGKAEAAFRACITGPVEDMHYQAFQDLMRATDSMRQTLVMFEDMR